MKKNKRFFLVFLFALISAGLIFTYSVSTKEQGADNFALAASVCDSITDSYKCVSNSTCAWYPSSNSCSQWGGASSGPLESLSCTDPDGANVYTKATTKGWLPYDNPNNDPSLYVLKDDYCRSVYADGHDPNWVQEFLCYTGDSRGAYITQASYYCVTGCENGACKPLAAQTTSQTTCPEGFIWDQGSSSCQIYCDYYKDQTSCTSRTECQWDSGNNWCKVKNLNTGTSNSTTTTNTTCESGYFWDSATNSCKKSCGSITSESTCKSYAECKWDSVYNSCYYTSTVSVSCSSGFYLDSSTNSCKVDCGYYKDNASCTSYSECKWDAANNWCAYSSSLASSCPVGYYWDSMKNSCMVDCSYYKNDQTSCSGKPECKWDTTYNGCVFAVSPIMTCGEGYILDPATNYCVSASGARVTGTVTDSSGSPVKDAFINVRKSDWSMSWGASSDSSGKYTVFDIKAGSYLLELSPSYNSTGLLSPAPQEATLKEGEVLTRNLSFLKATKTIRGTVKRSDGTAVNDAMVNAWQKDTNRYLGKEADSNGVYSLSIGGGLWEVSVFPKSGTSDWTFNEPPKSAIFANNDVTEEIVINFVVRATDAKVKGKILKPDGSALPANTAFVDLYSQTLGMGFGGPVDASGSFEVSVSAGTYDVHVFSQDNSFSAPFVNPVTVSKGETKDIGTIILQKATKTLKGMVTYQDGRPISDARVSAYKKDTQRWLDVKVESSGSYALGLTGGSWEISVNPDSMSPDWAYNRPPDVITFLEDTSPETKSLNFTVTTADAKIKGKILRPDGSVPKEKTIFVNVWSLNSGLGNGGPVMADGTFSISVPAGTYNMNIWSEDPSLTAPVIAPISVSKGETKDLGTITLITKSDHIKGKVTDKSGKGLSNIRVDAWVREGMGYSSTVTDGSGSYDLLVTPGRWEANAMPQDPSVSFYNPDPPKSVEVVAGVTSVIDFILLVADSGIAGNVVDPSGNILSDLYGFAQLTRTSISSQFTDEGFDFGFGPGIGGQIERGKFSFKAPAGTYNLQVFLSPDSPYTSSDHQPVTLVEGQTLNVKVKVALNNSKITGTVKDIKGNIITGVDTSVFATSKSGAWQETPVDRNTGKYVLKVAAGTWYIGYHVDPNSGYLSGEEKRVEVLVQEGETKIQDLVVQKAGSKITGQVSDPTGKGVAYVFVDVSKTSFAGIDFSTKPEEFSFVAGAMTDANGFYTVSVPAGTFFVNVFVPPHIGFISPKEQSITIGEGETKTLNLQVRSADLKISGKVFADGVAVKEGFVWAWSESGGYREAFTKSDGYYELAVAAQTTWHVGAGASINNYFYKSDEVVVKVGEGSVTHDITLNQIRKLDEPVTKISDATQPTVVESKEGVSVVAPATSVSVSGTVTISVTPDTRVASQGGSKDVVGVAYELEARQTDGTLVTSFNSDVTVSLPYKDEDLTALGVTEDHLSMAFWDESVATWKNIDTCAVNKEGNTVTCTVDHFTRFAIVSAADVTPPASPTNPSALPIGDGKIKLTWVNPDKDFSHAKIYRSTSQGTLGSVRAAEVKAVEYIDTGLLDGTTYYYTVRAVDPAGNESNNTNQVNAKAVGTSVEMPPAQTSGLKEGDLVRGPDGIKVYIINGFGFKRHIFNPAVFGMYKHFNWASIKSVSQTVLDSYKTSDLYRAPTDPKVYSLEEVNEVNGVAIKHHLEMTAAQYTAEGYDWNQVFIVNNEERDYYQTGAPIKSNK